MNTEKPMPILLIEDNEAEVSLMKEYVNTRDDVHLVKATNSSYEGLEYTKRYMPEGIILDLELHKGEGSGLEFLQGIEKLELDFKPLIVVTTNVSSDVIYSHVRNLGADFIFYKKQKDYNPEMVINSIVPLRKTIYMDSLNKGRKQTTTETKNEHDNRIKEKINCELDLIGIPNHLKGRKYLFEAIEYLLQEKDKDEESVFYYLAKKYKVVNSSISRAMQTAINNAWRNSPIEDLLIHYKARINYQTGVPSPTEFIYYYAEKLRKFV